MKFTVRWIGPYVAVVRWIGPYVAAEVEHDSIKIYLEVLTNTEREQLIESLTDAIDSLSLLTNTTKTHDNR